MGVLVPHPRLKALAVGDHEVRARAWYEHMPVYTVTEVGFRPICTVAVLLVVILEYMAYDPLYGTKNTQMVDPAMSPPAVVSPHRGPQLCLPVAVAMLPFPVRCLPRWKLYMVQPFEGKGDPAPDPAADPAAAPDPTAIPTDPTAYPP